MRRAAVLSKQCSLEPRRNRGMCSRPDGGVQVARSGWYLQDLRLLGDADLIIRPGASKERNSSRATYKKGLIPQLSIIPAQKKNLIVNYGWLCNSTPVPPDGRRIMWKTVQGGAASPT